MTELKLLGDICDFTYGKALRADHRSSGRVPVFGSNGIVGWHNQPITAGSTIIIGRKGSIVVIRNSPAQAFADLHPIVSKVLISAWCACKGNDSSHW